MTLLFAQIHTQKCMVACACANLANSLPPHPHEHKRLRARSRTHIHCQNPTLILVAFITENSSLEPLIEGLYAQIHVNLR